MKKPDEIAFYAALRKGAVSPGTLAGKPLPKTMYGGIGKVLLIAEQLGIHPKRAYCLLMKWVGFGWVDYGMWVWAGWFTPEAPESLQPIMGKQR